jgi:hypothetical protein
MANRYTVYNTDTSTAEATGKPWPTADGVSDPVGMPANLILLLEVTEAKPTYDSMTHKLVKDAINYDTINKTATTSWSVVALTQAEIDERTPEHYETAGGIKMATDLQSQAAFSNMMILLNEAGMADGDMVMIKDCFGASHAMTLADFRTQAVAYGLHCYQAFHSA